MKINLKVKQKKDIAQHISFFTEDYWAGAKSNFPENINRFFGGKKEETFILNDGKTVHYLIGLGKRSSENDFQKQTANFAQKNRNNIQPIATEVHTEGLDEKEFQDIIIGLFTGTYRYPFQGSHPFWKDGFKLFTSSVPQKELDQIAKRTLALCNGQFAAMDWLNKPANYKKTDMISAWLKEISQKYGFKYKAYNRKEAENKGLGAFVAVSQGSAMECAFTVIEYRTLKKNAKTVGLVGKCVLFDTGGISLKNPDNMHYMKSDLGGATAVIGTLIAAAELNLPVNIIAVLPITDNAISAEAYLPSDVITAYNGKTIEVLNTDAEGRMTLADGLSYLAKNYKTDYLIDLATLTGSAVRMFGDTCGAFFSNETVLKNALSEAGDHTHQRLWNLPLWEVWKSEFTSDVADFKNISMKPIGDCIVAAKFLEEFIEDHPHWAHLDIAGVAFGNVNYAKEKAATGYGVQLLVNFMENLL